MNLNLILIILSSIGATLIVAGNVDILVAGDDISTYWIITDVYAVTVFIIVAYRLYSLQTTKKL